MVLFDRYAIHLLGKITNGMLKGLPIDGDEDAFPDELIVIVDQRYI